MEAGGIRRVAINDVACLCECVVAASTSEVQLLSNASAVFDQIAQATAAFLHACEKISLQSKELARVAQPKSSIESLEDSVAFYEAREDELKKRLLAAIKTIPDLVSLLMT